MRRPQRKTADRGYGGAHQAERKKWEPEVKRGTFCRRCGLPIPPDGEGRCPALRNGSRCGKNHHGWDLGHHDHDRSVWTGPEHQCCNRATAGRRKRKRKRHSVDW